MSAFNIGDVLKYTPSDGRHCREGMAIVSQYPASEPRAHDTFWGSSGDRHLLTDDELATAELIFNVMDYDELDGNYSRHMNEAKWNTYAKDDRQLITSQHGLQKRWFIRKGAEPSWQQKIANAREELDEALRKADAAVRNVGYRHAELTLLIDKSSRKANL